MSGLMSDLGPFAIPLALIFMVVLVNTVRRAMELSKESAPGEVTYEQRLGGILFWGAMAALVGLLGQYSGIYMSLQGAARMEPFRSGLVAQGVAESMMSTVVGLGILIVAALSWFTLRSQRRRKPSA